MDDTFNTLITRDHAQHTHTHTHTHKHTHIKIYQANTVHIINTKCCEIYSTNTKSCKRNVFVCMVA